MNISQTYLLSKVTTNEYVKKGLTPDAIAIYSVDPSTEASSTPTASIITLFIILLIGFTTLLIKNRDKKSFKIICPILIAITLGLLIFFMFNLSTFTLPIIIILSAITILTNLILLITFRKDKILRIIFIILLLVSIGAQFFI